MTISSIVDKFTQRITALGALGVCALVAATSVPDLSSAQADDLSVASWYSLISDAGLPHAGTNCNVPDARTSWNMGVRFGVSYRLMEEHSGWFDKSVSLIRDPAKTVAQREIYAVNLNSLSSSDWMNIVRQATFENNPNLMFSGVMNINEDFIATPIQWNVEVIDSITDFLISSERNGLEDNQIAKAHISGVIADSLTQFGYAQDHDVREVHEIARSASVFCGQYVGFGSQLEDANVYLGLPFRPDLEGVDYIPLTTIGGVAGERLGTDIPSWPFLDSGE